LKYSTLKKVMFRDYYFKSGFKMKDKINTIYNDKSF